MGFRFRKSIKIAPGVKLNLGKKSAGISIGNKFGGVSYNTRTGARARVSAPGTGMSYSTKLGGASSKGSNKAVGSSSNLVSSSGTTPPQKDKPPRNISTILRWAVVVFMGLSAIVFFPSFASILLAFIALCALPIPSVINFLAAKLRLAGKLKAFVMFAFFLLAVMIAPTDTTTSEVPDTNDPPTIVETPEPAESPDTTPDTAEPEEQDTANIANSADDLNDAPDSTSNSSNETAVDSGTEIPATNPQQETPPAAQPDTSPAPQPEPDPVPQATPDDRTVYVTKTGKRYHYDSNCGNGTYYESTLSQAQSRGLTPCQKCAGG